MSSTRMMKIPCTVISEVPTGERDRNGDPITEPVEVETRCALQQQKRTENEDGSVSDSLWFIALPYGTQVGSGAVIKAQGREHEVVGELWNAEEGSRSLWHMEGTVQRRAGTGES